MIVERNKNGSYTAFHKKWGRPCLADMPTRLEAIMECWALVQAMPEPPYSWVYDSTKDGIFPVKIHEVKQ